MTNAQKLGEALTGSPYDDDVNDACAEHVFVRGHGYAPVEGNPAKSRTTRSNLCRLGQRQVHEKVGCEVLRAKFTPIDMPNAEQGTNDPSLLLYSHLVWNLVYMDVVGCLV